MSVSNDKWSEESQLHEAYRCLTTQPPEAQLRMLDWLQARIASDHAKAKKAREDAARARIAARAAR